MKTTLNNLGQPTGPALPNWLPPPYPPREPMEGRYCRVEPLDVDRHAPDLYVANSADTEQRMWTYLAYGPFADLDQYVAWLQRTCPGDDPFFHAIVDLSTSRAVGVASYLRITPASGSIEVGHIAYAPALQRTQAATEAMYLMMQRAFALGYRRYEWKCDALNARSRAAAQRLGFSFEGIFRQATVYKGRNRDTAWFAMIDQEWSALQRAFEQWLDSANFDANGQQRLRLAELTASALLHS
ncbi:MAG: GNAT family N-acetyltransferase [Herpetosiphonaceae bacterium]|nr:GNAT family N-acetyltransferase [Herpetosiphonaceae bacterium]